MSMHHSFDVEHARLFGLPEAVLISNLQFWISKNAANGVHQHEGRTWTYNSAKAFTELFPYFSDRQIRRTIDSLEAQAVVLKGNYNPSACDRTLWLAFVDEDAFLTVKKPAPNSANGSPKRAKPAPNSANGCAGISESLISTDVNPDVNTDKGDADAPAPRSTKAGFPIPDGIDARKWADWMQVRKAKRAPMTETAWDRHLREAEKAGISPNAAVVACCEYNWQGFDAQWYAERTALAVPAYRPAPAQRQPAESFAERDARAKRERWEQMTGRKWPTEELPSHLQPARQPAPLVIDELPNTPRRLA